LLYPAHNVRANHVQYLPNQVTKLLPQFHSFTKKTSNVSLCSQQWYNRVYRGRRLPTSRQALPIKADQTPNLKKEKKKHVPRNILNHLPDYSHNPQNHGKIPRRRQNFNRHRALSDASRFSFVCQTPDVFARPHRGDTGIRVKFWSSIS
jgi:hypothetical protein